MQYSGRIARGPRGQHSASDKHPLGGGIGRRQGVSLDDLSANARRDEGGSQRVSRKGLSGVKRRAPLLRMALDLARSWLRARKLVLNRLLSMGWFGN